MKPTSLLTEKDAAQFLNVSRVTLARSRCYGKPEGPPYIRMGRTIRYAVDDLQRFVEDRRVGGSE